jgi:hypothetical protein
VDSSPRSNRAHLFAIAVEAMRAHGLEPVFPPDALAEVAALNAAPQWSDGPLRALRVVVVLDR